eukprot:CAMPEP_0195525676 /NCGR_PEP_ID=MMETSP0794_2-20130614/26235_1 /TAXON_ID=515487 /ORGANISM="Stephanopyxis turris, Strain CCMP 815" /LENGTH=189 /DNA_ID=CAMNT_0040656179 /DNA_START=86 /DNA_END=655 /DNA_ORIENTATION=-
MPNKNKNKRSRGPKKDLINRLDKSFDEHLERAKAEVEATVPAPVAGAASDVDTSPPSTATSAIFAAMAVGPCVGLYASPKFGVTLADKGVLLIVVAVLSVVVLIQAYEANVESSRRSEIQKKRSTRELQTYAIFFVNLVFLLLFLTVGFLILPAFGGIIPTEANYFLTVAGNAVFVYLWQKGLILKGLA